MRGIDVFALIASGVVVVEGVVVASIIVAFGGRGDAAMMLLGGSLFLPTLTVALTIKRSRVAELSGCSSSGLSRCSRSRWRSSHSPSCSGSARGRIDDMDLPIALIGGAIGW